MPRNKNGHNQTHDIKQANNHRNGPTFTDNRDQQERLAKLLFQKENEKNRNNDFFRAQRDAQQRAQQAQQEAAQREAERREYREAMQGNARRPRT